MLKKRFGSKPKQNDQLSLQITSMADMLMIVLVFLLKSFSTNLINITPSPGTLLPEAHAQGEMADALKVEVSESFIQLEGKTVISLDQALFPKDVQAHAASLSQLSEAFNQERKRQNLIASQNPEVKVDSKILILASQKVPYSTLKLILATAATNGFSDFKLVVAKQGE